MAIKVKICYNSKSKLDLMEEFVVKTFGKKNVDIYDARKGYRKCDILISKGVGHDRSASAISLSVAHSEHHKNSGAKSIIFNKPIKVAEKMNKSFIFFIINGRRVYFSDEKMNPDRWNNFKNKIEPWKKNGDYILYCAQNGRPPFFHINEDLPYFEWQENFLKELSISTKHDIVYRPHPRGRLSNKKIESYLPSLKNMTISSNDNLYDDFLNAKYVITYNSTCSVNSIMKGIPTFVIDKNYITRGMVRNGLKFINKPLTPKRKNWFNSFGYCQWSEEEITNGIFWRYVKKHIF